MKIKTLIAATAALLVSAGLAGAAETTTGQVKVAHITGMDKAPQVTSHAAPVYPRVLQEQGIQGVATVEMLIDSTGRVVEATAVRSTAPEFAHQAVEAAKQWTFAPAEAKGQKIMARIQVPFEFVMPQVAALDRDRR